MNIPRKIDPPVSRKNGILREQQIALPEGARNDDVLVGLAEHYIEAYTADGLGLRQVLDWMMFVNRELDDEFWEKVFGPVAKGKGLDTLAVTVTRMCQIRLGLPAAVTWCSDADEALCDALLANLFSSGNFGRKQKEGTAVESVASLIRRQGFFRYLQAGGERNWMAFRRYPALKPFCWLYQLFRITFRGLKTGRGTKMTEDIRRSGERLELLKKLGVY